jgi:cholesterol transport system auxiliary component
MKTAPALGWLAAALSAGCSVLAPVRVDTTAFVLDQVPADVRAGPPVAAGISVPLPDAAPLYATRRMAYSAAPHEIGHFSESEWALAPAQMIQPLWVETLRRTGHFARVGTAPPGRADFVLRSEIIEVLQDFTQQPALFRLRVRVSLERGPQREVIAARELSQAQPLRDNTARAGVAAGNRAMEKLLRELADFAVENTPPAAR